MAIVRWALIAQDWPVSWFHLGRQLSGVHAMFEALKTDLDAKFGLVTSSTERNTRLSIALWCRLIGLPTEIRPNSSPARERWESAGFRILSPLRGNNIVA